MRLTLVYPPHRSLFITRAELYGRGFAVYPSIKHLIPIYPMFYTVKLLPKFWSPNFAGPNLWTRPTFLGSRVSEKFHQSNCQLGQFHSHELAMPFGFWKPIDNLKDSVKLSIYFRVFTYPQQAVAQIQRFPYEFCSKKVWNKRNSGLNSFWLFY